MTNEAAIESCSSGAVECTTRGRRHVHPVYRDINVAGADTTEHREVLHASPSRISRRRLWREARVADGAGRRPELAPGVRQSVTFATGDASIADVLALGRG